MKYMILIKANQEQWDDLETWTEDEKQPMFDYMGKLNDELVRSGEFIQGVGLDGPKVTRTVRAQDSGEPLVTDGPFGETKELLAGFWLVDVASEERAFEIAARASAAPGRDGKPANDPIEVHPVPDANIQTT
jgi:hypothetical protein